MDNVTDITPRNAKKIIAAELNKCGLTNRLTARTVSFSDLARCKVVFVEVHNWKPDRVWFTLKEIAIENGFRIISAGD